MHLLGDESAHAPHLMKEYCIMKLEHGFFTEQSASYVRFLTE